MIRRRALLRRTVRMNDPRLRFPVLCPLCKKDRYLDYRPAVLNDLLSRAATIPAWCKPCGHHWDLVTDAERADVMVLVDED
jgi:hypothetical protein